MSKQNITSDFIDLLAQEVLDRLMPMLLEKLPTLLETGPDRTLGIEEAAEYLGFSKELLYKMCSEKLVPHMRAGIRSSKKPRITFSSRSLAIWRREQEKNNYVGWHKEGDTS